MSKLDILAVVDNQFTDIRDRLEVQFTRTVELQQEIDAHRRELAEVREQIQRVHDLLQHLISTQ